MCYRRSGDGVEFLLVRTRADLGWTFPKGHLEPGESSRQAARREAKEEAAATGRMARSAFIRYRYPAWVGPGIPAGEVCIEAYLMEVTSRRPGGSVEGRRTAWFTPEVAAKKLAEGRHPWYARGLAQVISQAVESIRARSVPRARRGHDEATR